VHAQSQYPDKPITLVVPFAAGGNLDVMARLVGSSMSRTLGQSIVVSNRGGAGGLIGHESVARAQPDGYTIMNAPTTVIFSPRHLVRNDTGS